MIPRSLLLLLTLLLGFGGYAQSEKTAEDSQALAHFYQMMSQMFPLPIDTAAVSSENKHELLFVANCPFTEVIMSRDERGFMPYTSTSGASIFSLMNLPDELKPADRPQTTGFSLQHNNFLSEINTVYGCAEYVRERSDSITYSFQFHNEEGMVSYRLVPTIQSFFSSRYYSVLSFGNGEYVIAESSMIFNIGSQTSTGTTETLYFRKVRE